MPPNTCLYGYRRKVFVRVIDVNVMALQCLLLIIIIMFMVLVSAEFKNFMDSFTKYRIFLTAMPFLPSHSVVPTVFEMS